MVCQDVYRFNWFCSRRAKAVSPHFRICVCLRVSSKKKGGLNHKFWTSARSGRAGWTKPNQPKTIGKPKENRRKTEAATDGMHNTTKRHLRAVLLSFWMVLRLGSEKRAPAVQLAICSQRQAHTWFFNLAFSKKAELVTGVLLTRMSLSFRTHPVVSRLFGQRAKCFLLWFFECLKTESVWEFQQVHSNKRISTSRSCGCQTSSQSDTSTSRVRLSPLEVLKWIV